MFENVLRAFDSFVTPSLVGDATEEREEPFYDSGVYISALMYVTGVYQPEEDEPITSFIIGSDVAFQLSIEVELIRDESSKPEIILPNVNAVCFLETGRNRLPFHGAISKRARYRVRFFNLGDSSIRLLPAILVHQP